jgi:predicted ATP-binding protein involved in virulence
MPQTGSGKTVLLNLVNAFFSKQFRTSFKYPFSNLTLHFDTREDVEISTTGGADLFSSGKMSPDIPSELVIRLVSSREQVEPFRLSSAQSRRLKTKNNYRLDKFSHAVQVL